MKSSSISGNGNNFCNAIEGEFEAVTLINEINKERKRRGLSVIPAADDMCVTALMKGFTQKVGLSRYQILEFDCIRIFALRLPINDTIMS